MVYYAKSPEKDGSQETVQTHLQVVKNLAGEYGKAFGAEKSANCADFSMILESIAQRFKMY